MSRLAILFATSEMAPWVKTGGLGDVCAALPAALRQAGHDIRVLLPRYPALQAAFPAARPVAELPALAPALPPARLLAAEADGLPLLLLDCPSLYASPGNPYLDSYGDDRPDNPVRFGLLSRVAALLGQAHSPIGWQAEVVHANDWQTALAAAYLHYQGGAASVVTVHNIAFQGCFAHDYLAGLGLPEHAWRFDAVEYHGQLSFLKAGLQLASQISTVSPTYAHEIQDERLGYGLAPLLRYRAAVLHGILNGIDTRLWNPEADPALAQPYSVRRLDGKAWNKAALQEEMGLAVDASQPLFGVVSRMTQQKGLDLLIAIADELAELPAQLAVLGSGDEAIEADFLALAARHPGRIAVRLGFDEGLAHRIEAGADSFLMPSRFEPCGLNQLYSLRYGTPPVVHATGGLADTVVDLNATTLADGTANGFVMADDSAAALWAAIQRSCRTWQDRPLWQRLQHNGMQRDFSWKQAADAYIALYRAAIRAPRASAG
ncbi:MAG TPA: glycogen synthase GlgA [Pseudomonas sp.]|nr:glycogen synthase GlgA [Pseudomonas sp.]